MPQQTEFAEELLLGLLDGTQEPCSYFPDFDIEEIHGDDEVNYQAAGMEGLAQPYLKMMDGNGKQIVLFGTTDQEFRIQGSKLIPSKRHDASRIGFVGFNSRYL
jgi:hypothetical protein